MIYPNIGRKGNIKFLDNACMEPFGLAVLAGLTPSDIKVELYDDRIEEIPYNTDFDLVAISVTSFSARRSYEIAEAFRKRGVPVVLGGIHVTLAPEEAAEHANCIVIGDAELSWPELIDDLRHKCMRTQYLSPLAKCPQNGMLPCRDIFSGKKYLPVTLLQSSRGCPNQCSFCAPSVYFQKQRNMRDSADVVREIKAQKRKLLFFVDDNIVADKDAAKDLFRTLIPLHIRWVSQASMEMLDDSELMSLMMKSGCVANVIGFESIGTDSIKEMHKLTNLRYIENQYSFAVRELRRYGLQTWAAFTVGHDTDTVESIKETYAFALRNKFTFAAFNILYPHPSTPLYAHFEAENRLLYDGKWWLHPEYRLDNASFIPKNMTPDELTETAYWCNRMYNSPSSIFRRAFETHTNMRNPYRFFIYVVYNLMFRREVFNRQGLAFGYEED